MAYNGHPSWAYWNVSLWIGNDEGLYRLALQCIRTSHTRKRAAERLQKLLGGIDAKTPDGARYSVSALVHAMRGLT